MNAKIRTFTAGFRALPYIRILIAYCTFLNAFVSSVETFGDLDKIATVGNFSVNLDLSFFKLNGWPEQKVIIPGASFIGTGYDASKDYGTFENLRLPLFKKSFENYALFTEKFIVPENVKVNGIWKTFADSSVFSSETSFKKSLSTRVAGSGGGSCFGTSIEASASVGESGSSSGSQKSLYIVFEARTELFTITLDPKSLNDATKDFKDAIEILEKNTDDTKSAIENLVDTYELYHAFYEQFGTHYARSAVLGGNVFIEMQTEVSSDEEAKELAVKASASFSNMWASGSASAEHNNGNHFKNLQSKSTTKFRAFGGDPLSALIVDGKEDMKDAFLHWLKSVKTKPNIANFHLEPLYSLIPNDYSLLRLQMKTALDLYLARVPPKGKNFFDVLPRMPSIWSNTNAFKSAGKGFVSFYSLVSDSLTVQFASIPQVSVLTIDFNINGCSFKLLLDEDNVIQGPLDIVVPKAVYSLFWIQLNDGIMHVGVGNADDIAFKRGGYVTKNFENYKHLLKDIRYVGLLGTEKMTSSIVGMKIEQPKEIKKKNYESCDDYYASNPQDTKSGIKKLLWYGILVEIYCRIYSEGAKEFLKTKNDKVSCIGGSKSTVTSHYTRILPEFMVIDLCAGLNSHDSDGHGILYFKNHKKEESVKLSLTSDFVFDTSDNQCVANGDTAASYSCDLDPSLSAVSIKKLITNDDDAEGQIWYGHPYLGYQLPENTIAECKAEGGISENFRVARVQLKMLHVSKKYNFVPEVLRNIGNSPISPICFGGSMKVDVEAKIFKRTIHNSNFKQVEKYLSFSESNSIEITLEYLVEFPFTSKYEAHFDLKGSGSLSVFVGEKKLLLGSVSNTDLSLSDFHKFAIPCGVHTVKLIISKHVSLASFTFITDFEK